MLRRMSPIYFLKNILKIVIKKTTLNVIKMFNEFYETNIFFISSFIRTVNKYLLY